MTSEAGGPSALSDILEFEDVDDDMFEHLVRIT